MAAAVSPGQGAAGARAREGGRGGGRCNIDSVTLRPRVTPKYISTTIRQNASNTAQV